MVLDNIFFAEISFFQAEKTSALPLIGAAGKNSSVRQALPKARWGDYILGQSLCRVAEKILWSETAIRRRDRKYCNPNNKKMRDGKIYVRQRPGADTSASIEKSFVRDIVLKTRGAKKLKMCHGVLWRRCRTAVQCFT